MAHLIASPRLAKLYIGCLKLDSRMCLRAARVAYRYAEKVPILTRQRAGSIKNKLL